jgi:preprotein translocase subunit secB
MEISTPYASQLKLVDLMIVESSFSRTEKEIQDAALEMEIEKDIQKQSEDQYEITLAVRLKEKNNQINIYVKSKAHFTTQQENTNLIEKNTIAIIFPYVRSHISSITSQPGMMPIVLPPMNIAAMLKDNA